MLSLIIYSAFWFIVGAVSAVLFVDALRMRAEIQDIRRQRGQA